MQKGVEGDKEGGGWTISNGGLHVRLQNARHWPKIERVGGDWCTDIPWSSTLSHEEENKRANEICRSLLWSFHAYEDCTFTCHMNEG